MKRTQDRWSTASRQQGPIRQCVLGETGHTGTHRPGLYTVPGDAHERAQRLGHASRPVSRPRCSTQENAGAGSVGWSVCAAGALESRAAQHYLAGSITYTGVSSTISMPRTRYSISP